MKTQTTKHTESKQIFIKSISGMNCGVNIFSIAGEVSHRKDKQVDPPNFDWLI